MLARAYVSTPRQRQPEEVDVDMADANQDGLNLGWKVAQEDKTSKKRRKSAAHNTTDETQTEEQSEAAAVCSIFPLPLAVTHYIM